MYAVTIVVKSVVADDCIGAKIEDGIAHALHPIVFQQTVVALPKTDTIPAPGDIQLHTADKIPAQDQAVGVAGLNAKENVDNPAVENLRIAGVDVDSAVFPFQLVAAVAHKQIFHNCARGVDRQYRARALAVQNRQAAIGGDDAAQVQRLVNRPQAGVNAHRHVDHCARLSRGDGGGQIKAVLLRCPSSGKKKKEYVRQAQYK